LRRLEHPLVLLLAGLVIFAGTAAVVGARAGVRTSPGVSRPGACALKPPVKHVVYLVFDNVHFLRDASDVPSDLEQMPHLLDFIESNGTLLTNHHTPLIAHTGGDIITGLTGVYPDRHGQAVSNSYRYYTGGAGTGEASTYTYWTALSHGSVYNLVSETGANAPAPWPVFTKAGCDVGAAGVTGMVLETEAEVKSVLGGGSSGNSEGLAVHCAPASKLCAGDGVRPDRLPGEPGGYEGFEVAFGQRSLGPLLDLEGRPLNAFPGFGSLPPATTLAYVASMQERGVPVTFGYISDAHGSFAPGDAGYRERLSAYDRAFASFFERLARDGIDRSNTIFAITADEGDHFVGGGGQRGEVLLNLTGLLTNHGVRTPFTVHADSAPAVYLEGDPAPDAAVTRAFQRAASLAEVANPYRGATEKVTGYVADRAELKLLHMVTGDPARTPSMVWFLKPDYFGEAGSASCAASCARINPSSAWNHGSVAPDMNTTWLGFVGPGVPVRGLDPGTWSDEVDIRPTLLFLAGLRDAYPDDGRVLVEALDAHLLGRDRAAYLALAQMYKRIDAPLGDLGIASLAAATQVLASAGDADYAAYLGRSQQLAAKRDQLVAKMSVVLERAIVDGQPLDAVQARALVEQAQALLGTKLV
jgi:hypothetical protein